MNLNVLKKSFNQFSSLELSRTQKREQSFNYLIQNIVAIRANCIPKQALHAFDKTPFSKLPNLLEKLNVDPLAKSDLASKLSAIENEQGNVLITLNLQLVQETIQSSKRWKNVREIAPEIKPNTTAQKKEKGLDGPSFEL